MSATAEMLRADPVATLPDPHVDEVDVVGGASLWVAFSTSSLEADRVFLEALPHGAGGPEGARLELVEGGRQIASPALTLFDEGVLLMGAAHDGLRPALAGMVVSSTRGPRRFLVPVDGVVGRVAVTASPGRDRAVVAWEERGPGVVTVRLGRIDHRGRLERLPSPIPAPVWAAAPALAVGAGGVAFSWVEAVPRQAGQVRVACLGRDDCWSSIITAAPSGAGAPAVAWASQGALVVACHTASWPGEGVASLPQLQAVEVASDGTVRDLEVPLAGPGCQEEAGVDQGWMLPQVAVEPDGTVWLAGRSSQGYQVAAWQSPLGWSPRLVLTDDFWGGRGRRHALQVIPGGVLFARREPDGVVVSHLGRGGATAAVEKTAPTLPVGRPDHARTVAARGGATALAAGGPPILFGDLHQHSIDSDGLGEVEGLLLVARDGRGFDFAAVTDHDRFCRRALGPTTWRSRCHVVEALHEPGRFVTFVAYEYTGARHPGPGHKCLYFGDRYPAALPPHDLEATLAMARDYEAIVVPHHVGWTGADMEHHDPWLQPVWELCSVHGTYESVSQTSAFPPRSGTLPGHFVRDALDTGLRFGFIGGTDSHGLLWHHGISARRDPFATGLAAVVGARRERVSIMQALRERRAYATTGARILLHVELDGAPMGSALPAGTAGGLRIEVVGTGSLASVTLVRTGREQRLGGGDGPRFAVTVQVSPVPDRPCDYLYVRVVQEDGETAWSSPLWIG